MKQFLTLFSIRNPIILDSLRCLGNHWLKRLCPLIAVVFKSLTHTLSPPKCKSFPCYSERAIQSPASNKLYTCTEAYGLWCLSWYNVSSIKAEVMFCFFFPKDFIYLFLERGEGRKKGRETSMWEKHPLVASSTHPDGDWSQAYAMTGNQTGDLLLCRNTPNQLSHMGQGKAEVFVLFSDVFKVLATVLGL